MRFDHLLALGLSLLSPHSPTERPGLTLETGSPDALCPELTRTREAVDRRLGALDVNGGAGWRARYTMGHAPEGQLRDFVRLELFDPGGDLRLRRDLPIEGDSCTTMADVIALVLERYFRSLDLEHETPLEEAPPPEPVAAEPTRAAPQQAPAPRAREVVAGPVVEPRLSFLSAEVGLSSPPFRPTLGARFNSELFRRVYFGAALSLALTPRTERPPLGGEVKARAAMLRGLVAWAPSHGPVRPYLGPEIVLVTEYGEALGLDREDTGLRAVWGVGVAAGLVVELGGPWLLSASASGEALIPSAGGTFVVEGEEVLRPPSLQGSASAGVGYAFSL